MAGVMAGIVGYVVVGELTHWWTARKSPKLEASSSAGIIVMGYGSRSQILTRFVQKWRVRVAVRSLLLCPDAVLIFSGAAVSPGAARTEADQMADLAITKMGVPSEQVRRERHAKNSWENVERGIREADGLSQIAFASDPFHVSKAHRYAVKQDPWMTPGLRRGADYRLFEVWWLKPPLAVHAAWHWFRDRRFTRAQARASAK